MAARLDRTRLLASTAAEEALFTAGHPRSRELFEQAQRPHARRRADELDGAPGESLPAVRARGAEAHT